MKTVLRILEAIASEPKAKDKKSIIKANEKHPLFLKVAKYAYDQDKHYNLKNLPAVLGPADGDTFQYLDFLASKRGCSKLEAIKLAKIVQTQYGDEGTEVVNRIVKKDLKCGAKTSTFNSLYPDMIYEVPYQRYKSSSYLDRVDFENEDVLFQLKMDGMFAYCMPGLEFISRNGSNFKIESLDNAAYEVREQISDAVREDVVLIGELITWDGEKYLTRKASNGVINKFISGEGDSKYEIHYVIWGFVTKDEYDKKKSNTPYSETFEILSNIGYNDQVKLVESYLVKSKGEALEKYSKVRKRKEEGGMVKVVNKLMWRDQRSGSAFGVKLKPFAEAEFEIVDAYYGDPDSKWAKYLGGITVKSSDGEILTNVGMGFSDDERLLGPDWWKGKKGGIVTVKYYGITTDKSDRETFCLEHASFQETRFNEKSEADTYDYCLEEIESA